MVNSISSSFDEALQWFHQIGVPGNEGVRVLSNSSENHAKTFFEQLTKNSVNDDIVNTINGPIFIKFMPDGSKIQYRNWATQSDNVGNIATIEFIDGNYSNQIQKIKFNE